MDDNKKFWQRFAKLYSPFMEKSNAQVYDRIAEETTLFLSNELTVLELACGSGQLSFRLASYAKHWEATDFSENMIAEAKKNVRPRNLFFSVKDATDLPYADESFNAVMIANALHIMPEPDKAMNEIHRVLKSGGLLFAPTFVHGSGVGFMLRTKILKLVGFHVFSKWTADEFVDYVCGKGFTYKKSCLMGSSIAPLLLLAASKN